MPVHAHEAVRTHSFRRRYRGFNSLLKIHLILYPYPGRWFISRFGGAIKYRRHRRVRTIALSTLNIHCTIAAIDEYVSHTHVIATICCGRDEEIIFRILS